MRVCSGGGGGAPGGVYMSELKMMAQGMSSCIDMYRRIWFHPLAQPEGTQVQGATRRGDKTPGQKLSWGDAT